MSLERNLKVIDPLLGFDVLVSSQLGRHGALLETGFLCNGFFLIASPLWSSDKGMRLLAKGVPNL